MIRIAVADDDISDLEQNCAIVNSFFESLEVPYELNGFNKSGDLLWDIEDGKEYDIYLLDIEMPVNTGLDIAGKIRERSLSSYIVMISNYMNYAIEGYKYSTFRYIMKSQVEKELPEALYCIYESIMEDNERYYSVDSGPEGIERIKFNDICYIEKKFKYCCFHLKDGREYRQRKTLSEAVSELDSDEFVYIHKSMVVNLRFVQRLVQRTIHLTSGQSFEVSSTQIRNLKMMIMRYWGKGRK